jgi:hypothetical protein
MDKTPFQILKDTLALYVGPGEAHRKAVEIAPQITRAVVGESPTRQELTGATSQVLRDGIQRTFEDLAEEIRYYYAAEPFGYDEWDRGIANPEVWDSLPTHVTVVEVLVAELLKALNRADRPAVLPYVAGTSLGAGAADSHPLCIQQAAGEQVTLYFPGVVRRVIRAASSLAPAPWHDDSVAEFEDPLQLVADVFSQKLSPKSDAEWFVWLYQAASNVLGLVESLSAMQWVIGEVVAGYGGISQFELEAVRDRLTSDFMRSNGSHQSELKPILWTLLAPERTDPGDDVDVATGIRIVGRALRHAMLDERIELPVISNRIFEDPNGQQSRVTITVNHPLVGMADVMLAARQGLSDLRKLGFNAGMMLSSEETIFAEAVEALRRESAVDNDERVPHGFWTKFTEIWNRDHPDDPLTVNNARVRHHRLKNRQESWISR